MKLNFRSALLASAIAGALAAGPAAAAVKLSDAFDGSWLNPAEAGRGAVVDYIPLPDGSGQLFIALFTYDAEGNPFWVTLQPTFPEHEFQVAGATVNAFAGGSFGSPYDNPGASSSIGTGTVTINSCGSMTVALDMDGGSGLDDVTLELTKGFQAVGLGTEAQCVYQSEFTGCPDFAVAGPAGSRACVLNGVYNEDILLTNDTTWILDGLVRIGDDNANSGSVTIEPGTVIVGGGGSADYLYVSPGSQIFANGTPNAPIVMTSDQDGFAGATADPAPGDLGGLVVSGNAPVNACPEAPFECFSEFDQTQRFGGDDPDESSGEISYFQVRYAGIEFQENAEVNSFTFQGVGRGTQVHHIQSYRGQDDGVEFFGGTVNVKYVVLTEGGDDAIDWDLGWSGNIQFGLVSFGDGFGEDHGVEAANNPDDFDALPRATPVQANITFIGNGSEGDGIRLKEGSGGQTWNSVVVDFAESCINLTDGATYAAAGTPAAPTGATAFAGVLISCDNNFKQDGDAPYTTQAFFESFPGNDAVADPMLNGYMPMAGSPALEGGQVIPGLDFFSSTPYRGAFDGSNDWTVGWTVKPGGDALAR